MRPKLLRSISVRLPDELLERVNRQCEEASISRSALFRTALEDTLDQDPKDKAHQDKFARCG
jgi:metal-responsive CopG/Arc/MetJ family transcriptional regulator